MNAGTLDGRMLRRDLLHALDPVVFAQDLDMGLELDPWQREVLRSTSKRLILNCSRQSGKSTTAAVLGVHEALYHPGLVLLVSPSLRQSGELFRKVSQVLEHVHQQPELVEDNKLSLQLTNGSRIISLPSSEKTIRGFSAARLIIEDEASRVEDDFYYAIRPMLAVSGGSLVLMSTPFGKRGHFFEEWTKGQDWHRIMITADQCSRISKKFLDEERRTLGEWRYRQEYECEFVETVDQVLPYDLIMEQTSEAVAPLWGGRSFFT